MSEAFANRNYRLLLVEDSPVNRMVMAKTLTKHGYRVDAVADSGAALAALEARYYDLILLDLNLPDRDGYGVTAAIRRLMPPQNGVPIVAVTADVDEAVIARCDRAGVTLCLEKPLPGNQLVAVVAKQLGQIKTVQAAGLLDENVIDQLQADTDAETLQEAVELFLQESHSRLAAIKTACRQQDWRRVQNEAHTLKSSAGLFGARGLKDCAQRLHTACEQQQWDAAMALSGTIAAVAAPVLQTLAERFSLPNDKFKHKA